MPIHPSSSVEECGDIWLELWSIRQSEKGVRHFVGFNCLVGTGRVSTAILSFDAQTRVGRTASGRTYHLVGRAGHDRDAEYVWGCVVQAWGLGHWTDVTAELCPDWRDPVPAAEREN